MNKPTAHTQSFTLAVVLVLGQLIVSHAAYADSVDEWGYWESSTAAGPGSPEQDGLNNLIVENFDSTDGGTNPDTNSDTNTTRFNRGQVTAPSNNTPTPSNNNTSNPQYVGYTLCYYNCNGVLTYNSATTAGTIYMDAKQGAARATSSTHYSTYVSDTNDYDGQLTITGLYNGQAFNINDSQANFKTTTDTYNWGYSSYTDVSSESGTTYLKARLSSIDSYGNGSNPVSRDNQIGANNTKGAFYYGQPVAAAQIAEQLRLGQTYQFSGSSYMGSNVNITVNFQNASWNGSWTEVSDYSRSTTGETLHNGFSAAGGISGSTLTSTSVTGAGTAGVGYVTGGKVDGTLVGSIVGANASAAAVIGKTVVDVQQTVGTKPVADIFSAGIKQESGVTF